MTDLGPADKTSQHHVYVLFILNLGNMDITIGISFNKFKQQTSNSEKSIRIKSMRKLSGQMFNGNLSVQANR